MNDKKLEKKTVLSNRDLNLLRQVRRIHSNPIITATIPTQSNYMPAKGEVVMPTGDPVTEELKHDIYGFKLIDDLSPGPNSVKFYVPEPFQNFEVPETNNPQVTEETPRMLPGFAKAILKPQTILLGGLALASTGFLYKCKSPESPPTFVNYTGHLQGLFNGSPVSSGEIIFNHATRIPIIGGSYNINSEHNLIEGNYHVRIETVEGLPREVSKAHLSNNGLYVDKSNLRLDNVIEKNAIDINEYNDWLTSRGSERWLTNTPRFFLYDNSLWRRNNEGVLEIINNNYDVNPATIAAVEDVVLNDIHLYTSGFVRGQLFRESQSSERPDPRSSPSGWIIYMIRDDIEWAIEQGHGDDDGDIFNGLMGLRKKALSRGTVSIDTAQTLGIGQQHNAGEVHVEGYPSPKAKRFAKIIYNRAPHHKIIGDIDTEE